MTFKQKLVTFLAIAAVVALFTGVVLWDEFAAFVLQLVGMAA